MDSISLRMSLGKFRCLIDLVYENDGAPGVPCPQAFVQDFSGPLGGIGEKDGCAESA